MLQSIYEFDLPGCTVQVCSGSKIWFFVLFGKMHISRVLNSQTSSDHYFASKVKKGKLFF